MSREVGDEQCLDGDSIQSAVRGSTAHTQATLTTVQWLREKSIHIQWTIGDIAILISALGSPAEDTIQWLHDLRNPLHEEESKDIDEESEAETI